MKTKWYYWGKTYCDIVDRLDRLNRLPIEVRENERIKIRRLISALKILRLQISNRVEPKKKPFAEPTKRGFELAKKILESL